MPEYEYKVNISGTDYIPEDDSLQRVKIHRFLFETFGAGNAAAASIEVEIKPKAEVPRMAVMQPFAREIGSDSWFPLGMFYLDYPEADSFTTTLFGYDAMLKGEVIYNPIGDQGTWPKTMVSVANDICTRILGLQMDSRTVIPPGYMLQYPNEYTAREILCHIAAACGGNWTITAENKLLLVPLFGSMPEETNYLVDDFGMAIKFPDGVRLLV